MATLAEIRAQYPQYNDMSDRQLADSLYQKHYSDMPRAEFDRKVGLAEQKDEKPAGETGRAFLDSFMGNPVDRATRTRDFAVGAAHGLADPVLGLQQMIGRAVGDPKYQTGVDANIKAVDKSFQERTGGTTAANIGRVGGNILPTLPLAAIPGMGAASLAPRLAASAGAGAVAATLTPEADSQAPDFWQRKATEAGIGAGFGAGTQVVGTAVGKAIAPIRNILNPEQQRLAQTFEREVGPLTAGQATGSKPITMAESALSNLPGSASAQNAIYSAQRKNFTKAVLAKAGIQADSASPEVLGTARKAFSQAYDDLSSRTTVVLDQPFERDIQAALGKYTNSLKADQAKVFMSKANELLDMSRQRVTLGGERFQNIRTGLSEDIRDYAGSDPRLASALKELKAALTEADKRSTPATLQGIRKDLDERYAIFKTIEDAMKGTTTTGGDISPVQLFNVSSRRGTAGAFVEGKGALNDMSRSGVQFLRPPPDSGTASRAFWNNVFTGGGMTAAGAAGGAAYGGGDPQAMMAGAGIGLLGPYLAQRGLSSKLMQGYLRSPSLPPGLLGRSAPGVSRGLLDITE